MKFQVEPFHRNVTDDELLADLRRVAAELGERSVATREYNDHGRFHSNTLMARFGTWTDVCSKVGLETRLTPRNPPDEELFQNLEEMWIKLGRQPRYREVRRPFSTFGNSPYLTRFRTWEAALNAFVAYINSEETPQSEDSIRDWKIESTTKHKTPRAINWRLRFVVMRRDNFRCKCGRSPATDTSIVLHVDHIVAWSKGGETVIENLQTLCSVCNIGKSDLEFISPSGAEVEDVEA